MNNIQKAEDRGHSELGGSYARVWMNCTGAIFLGRQIPKEKAGPDAERGTLVHSCCEKALATLINYCRYGNSETISTEEFGEGADEEAMLTAAEYAKVVWEKVLFQSITSKAYGIEDLFTVEHNLKMYGYVDFWCIYIDEKGKRAACIVDFKNGYQYVPVKNNPQLAFYAVALLQEIRKGGKDLDYVRTAIYQPNGPQKDAYSETKYTAKQLEVWHKKFLKAAETIYVKQKEIFKVGDWCKNCHAQTKCKKYNEVLSKTTALKLVDVDTIELPKPEMLSDETVLKLALAKEALTGLLKANDAYILSRHRDGKPVPGIKPIQKEGRRGWKKNEEEKIIEGLIIAGLTKDDVTETKVKLRGITEVEKKLIKNFVADPKELLSPFVEKGSGAIVLVPESDPRPAISAVKDAFETYET